MGKLDNNNWIATCRGIAVIGVVLTHFLPQLDKMYELNSKIISTITVDFLDVGKIGVALLFLISGYLAPASKKKRSRKMFIINRFFRLYPLYWASIILFGILFSFNNYDIGTVLSNITMLQSFMGKKNIVGVFWTLPIELLLYGTVICFEKYLWEFKSIYRLEAIYMFGTIILAIIRNRFWHSAPVAIGLLLTVGILGQIFRLYKDKDVTTKELQKAILLFVIGLIVSSYLSYQIDAGHNENWYRYVISYSFAIFLFLFLLLTQKKIFLFSKLAEISYPIYIFQELIFIVVFNSNWHMPIYIFMIITFVLLFLISVISHVLIEKPLINLCKRIEKRR